MPVLNTFHHIKNIIPSSKYKTNFGQLGSWLSCPKTALPLILHEKINICYQT